MPNRTLVFGQGRSIRSGEVDVEKGRLVYIVMHLGYHKEEHSLIYFLTHSITLSQLFTCAFYSQFGYLISLNPSLFTANGTALWDKQNKMKYGPFLSAKGLIDYSWVIPQGKECKLWVKNFGFNAPKTCVSNKTRTLFVEPTIHLQ